MVSYFDHVKLSLYKGRSAHGHAPRRLKKSGTPEWLGPGGTGTVEKAGKERLPRGQDYVNVRSRADTAHCLPALRGNPHCSNQCF